MSNPLVKIFSSSWRGLGGETEDGRGLILDFHFRENLHLFHGAKLGVFMAIVLHCDESYRSWPGYDLLQKETGYSRDTIARALEDLCKMEVGGKRVLLRYRERNEAGQFDGSNRYIVFPTEEEIAKLEGDQPESENRTVDQPESDFPKLDFPTSEKSDSKLNPLFKLNHSLSVSPSAEDLKELEAQKKRERAERIVAAVQQSQGGYSGLEETVHRLFRISPNWRYKNAQAFKAWYDNERKQDQTLDAFARWWYTKDWRGTKGQPPTLEQIRELWPQAFVSNAPGQPELTPELRAQMEAKIAEHKARRMGQAAQPAGD
jgi:hypothetical protein